MWWEWCRREAPFLTYISGFLLSQLKLLLGVLKSLGVLVQLILSSLQLLLQSYQIVLQLKWGGFSGRAVSEVISEQMRERAQAQQERAQRDAQDRTPRRQETGKREEDLGKLMHLGIVYLGGDFFSGQELFLSGLELLKHFISFVFRNTQFLFQLSYIVL